MKYCTHCGKELLDEAIVCPGCGCSVQYDGDNTAKNDARDSYASSETQTQYTQHNSVPDTYSTMSILGLVFSFIGALIGLIISILAFKEAKRTGSQKSKSMATAGIIISSIEVGIVVIYVFIMICVGIAAIGAAGGF